MNKFLPVTASEIKMLGWENPDVILISGDAYVDHPSFSAAIIGRWLQHLGLKVAILPQPDWTNPDSFKVLGKPRLFFGITSGNMDSMINKYTARKKLRSKDAYSPGGSTDKRPDRATIVYSQIVHSIYKDTPIILGGIEASMRRLPHYDYWSDKIRNSILFDSRADMLVYGMGENAIREVALALKKVPGVIPDDIRGTAVLCSEKPDSALELPEYHKKFSYDDLRKQHLFYEDNYRSSSITQLFAGRWLKVNPPAVPLSTEQMDELYSLPFQRETHPVYKKSQIAAFEQIKHSITSHRGCFGGCSFCGIGYHQGKTIQSRSAKSIKEEVKEISAKKYFHGTISDLGGPSANMWGMYCGKGISAECKRTSCLFPKICPHLVSSQKPVSRLLKSVANFDEVKHLFVASGIRFDLALLDNNYIKDTVAHYTSGLLKVAPEHISPSVLKLMQKPEFEQYKEFVKRFSNYSRDAGKKQAVVPYIIVGHPGAKLADTIKLAVYLKNNKIKLKQIQEYIPLPMTASTLMYVTEKDLRGNAIHVAKGREIRLMKALIQWYVPENKKLIIEALKKANRKDLINFFL